MHIICVRMCICVCACICVHVHVCICMHMCVYMCVCVCVYVCVCEGGGTVMLVKLLSVLCVSSVWNFASFCLIVCCTCLELD